MIIKKINVEAVDPETRFVLKRIQTTDWESLNRKMAVTNQLHKYETQRRQYGKNPFNSQIQTYHIRWDKKGFWDFGNIDVAKTDAQKNNRIFVAQRQMNWDLWKKLTTQQAFNQYEELTNKGLPIPSINIPLKNDLTACKKIIEDAKSILNGNQKIMAIASSRHDFTYFPEVIDYLLNEIDFVGIQGYGLTHPEEITNLSALRKSNATKKAGDTAPLIFGFNFDRHLRKYGYVSSSFAYACFGIDIFSERQYFINDMTPEQIKQMMERTPEDFRFYDSSQGGFNRGEEQEGWHEFNLTRETMAMISVEEGLNGYQTIVWTNAIKQQNDLSMLNGKLLQKMSIPEATKEKSKWAVFYATQVELRG